MEREKFPGVNGSTKQLGKPLGPTISLGGLIPNLAYSLKFPLPVAKTEGKGTWFTLWVKGDWALPLGNLNEGNLREGLS